LVSAIKGLGVPRGATAPVRGMRIVKVGRTTNRTTGTIRDVHFRFALDYDDLDKSVGFLDQVFCTRYSKPGDSGSLVLDQASKKAVGLHFAGADGGSVFSPIGTVLATLGVTLVTTALGSPQRVSRAGRGRGRRRPRRRGCATARMATERHAHLARERHSAYLRSLGAHAIAADRAPRRGQPAYRDSAHPAHR